MFRRKMYQTSRPASLDPLASSRPGASRRKVGTTRLCQCSMQIKRRRARGNPFRAMRRLEELPPWAALTRGHRTRALQQNQEDPKDHS